MSEMVNRLVASFLIVCTVGLGVPLPASAGIVATPEVAAGAGRDRVKSFLDRSDVRQQLEALGVDARAARERVDALADEEVASLAGRIDQLPAGADGGVGIVIGAVLLVFIILLITDILGLTKVYPFTRPVR